MFSKVQFYVLAVMTLFAATLNARESRPVAGQGVELKVFVFDADLKAPIELARVVLRREKIVIGQKVTNPAGLADFTDVDPGSYRLSVHCIGYSDFYDSILVDERHSVDSIFLHVVGQKEVLVVGQHELSVASFDLTTGNQIFESETY